MTLLCRRLLPAVFLVLITISVGAQSAQPGQAAGSRPAPQAGAPGSARPGGSQAGPLPNGVRPAPREWWTQKSEFNTKLHLTVDQSSRIQQIFDAAMTQIRKQNEDLNRLLDKLSRHIQNDETLDLIAQQIDRVEATRGAANKTRTLMLIEMRRVLTPQQRATLEVLSEQWMKDEDQRQQNQRQNQGPRQDQNRKPDQNSSPQRRGGRLGL